MAEKKKAQYAPPGSQVDLEARQATGNASDRVLTTADVYEAPAGDEGGREFAVEGNDTDGYIGVSPEYRTYANETEAPVTGDDSPERKVEEYFVETLNTEAVKPGAQASTSTESQKAGDTKPKDASKSDKSSGS